MISDGKFPEIFTGRKLPETFRQVSGNFTYDVRASFFSRLFFNRFIYVTVILRRHFALFMTFEGFSGSTR
jgi:hypothetical protein